MVAVSGFATSLQPYSGRLSSGVLVKGIRPGGCGPNSLEMYGSIRMTVSPSLICQPAVPSHFRTTRASFPVCAGFCAKQAQIVTNSITSHRAPGFFIRTTLLSRNRPKVECACNCDFMLGCPLRCGERGFVVRASLVWLQRDNAPRQIQAGREGMNRRHS